MPHILASIDFSDVTDRVLSEAARYAKLLEAKIWIVHITVPEPGFMEFQEVPQQMRQTAATQLRKEHKTVQDCQKQLRAQGLNAEGLLLPGNPMEKVVEEAKRLGAELIIIGSHGHGALHHLLAGSVCQSVLKHAPCPVLVVPSPKAAPDKPAEGTT